MSTPDITSAMNAAMDAENRRRQAASGTPGLGVLLPMEQSPAAAAIGKSSLDMPAIGEGYDQVAEISGAVHKAYGEARPVYAADEVGGLGYVLPVAQPARRHVSDLGDGRLLFDPGPDGRQPGGSFVFASPPAKPGLLARLSARLRRR